MARPLILLMLLVPLLTVGAHAQTIHGLLLDAESGAPVVAGTMVLLSEDSVPVERKITNDAGEFGFSAPGAGGYRLSAARVGYHAAVGPLLELEPGDSLEVEFLVSTDAVLLQPVTVVASSSRPRGLLGGFYDRMERGTFGTFVTRDDIEKRQPIYPSDLLRTIPGVQVVPTWSGRAVVLMRGLCVPQIYLDGMRIRTASIDELVSVIDLDGIEVYNGPAGIPVEFSGFGGCGAILLWTRRGG